MNPISAIGKAAVDTAANWAGNTVFLGETFASAVGMLVHPRRFRFGDFALAFQRAAYEGLPIAMTIGFLLGLILAFQSAAVLEMFGVKVFVADLLAFALFRELGPLVTAILLAGRSGSAFAAEIGTMKVDEELDALTTMGLPPVRFLVMPRVAAATLAMPVLTIFAEIAGLLGGVLVMLLMNVPPAVYWRHVVSISTVRMILTGLGKGALFGALVATVSCAAGMRTKSTADGVGLAATSAVVGSIVTIAVTDGLLAVIFYVWKI